MVARERLGYLKEYSTLVLSWFETALDHIERNTFAQIDIDELLGAVPEYAGSVSLDVFRVLVERAVRVDGNPVPLLVLPLSASHRLLTKTPSLDLLLQRKWRNLEVPGFYLTTTPVWFPWEKVEEYRTPVDSLSVLPMLSPFYRVFRSLEARAKSWEYERAFYIWPSGAADAV